MNIDKLISVYLELYPDTPYTTIADKMLMVHDIDLSHRTLRQKLSEAEKSSWVDVPSIKTATLTKPKLQPYTGGNPKNVLVIGDTHIPFEREGYLEHCRAVQEKYDCGTVVHIGDIIDSHYSSFHEQDPDGRSAGDELAISITKTKEWHRVFPNAYCTIGNHDAIIMRKAFSSGLSSRWIKGMDEVLEMPTWKFVDNVEIDGIMYTHQLGANLFGAAMARRQSLVCGHHHTKAEIQWNANKGNRIFSMFVGCGIDDKAYAFNYAKLTPRKSFISCAVVLDGGRLPIIEPMDI